VFASYIILLIFSALFGPILRITAFGCMCEHNCIKQCCNLDPNCGDRRCILGHNKSPRHRDCRHKHNYSRFHNFVWSWNELQGKFLDSQAFFVIPAIVASFVELSHIPAISTFFRFRGHTACSLGIIPGAVTPHQILRSIHDSNHKAINILTAIGALQYISYQI
jgi:hypothetical protein